MSGSAHKKSMDAYFSPERTGLYGNDGPDFIAIRTTSRRSRTNRAKEAGKVGFHSLVSLLKEKHMHLPFLAFLALLVAASGAFAQASSVPISSVHNGLWSVALVCPDVKNQTGLIKGYEYTFAAVVKDGKLEAQYGKSGEPDSLSLAGIVHSDGTLEITANGIVGASSNAVGKVPRGTPYHYTMRGHLGGTGGQAERREARACTATFSRQ